MYAEEDFLMLSGLQHFAYCRRQWGLIHIEQQWAENERTVDGNLFHSTAHNADKIEKRGDKLITRGLRIKSNKLGLSGTCDVVEFHKSVDGIYIHGYEGKWIAYPIEYKKGLPKEHHADEMQLCAQAMCLEEMLSCSIFKGSLFYGENHRRTAVEFDDTLRDMVINSVGEMHELWKRGYTPKVKPKKGCNACSLKDVCVPRLTRAGSVKDFIKSRMSLTDTRPY